MTDGLRGQWWSRTALDLYPLDDVERLTIRAFTAAGLAPEDAAFAAAALIAKDLEDDYIRGVTRAPDMVRRLLDGTYDPRAELGVLEDRPAMAIAECGRGFPRTMAHRAMKLCIQKARTSGIGSVGLQGTTWSLGEHLRLAASEGIVALITTQGSASMAPLGGSEPIMSNAPVGIGIPAAQLPPIILDMSLTQSSASPVIEALLEGRLLPSGIGLDERGLPTTNPNDVFKREGEPPQWTYRGSLVPIGGYKGYGLATAMMVLSSLLVGARPAWERMSSPNPSEQQPSPEPAGAHKGAGGGSSKPGTLPARPGTLFICLDVAAFTPLDAFRAEVDTFLTRIISSRKAGDDEIAYPGLRSGRLQAARRERNVVPLAAKTPIALNELARQLGLNDQIGDPTPMGERHV